MGGSALTYLPPLALLTYPGPPSLPPFTVGMGPVPEAILQLFTHHADMVAAKAKLRKNAVQLKAQVNDAVGGALLDIRDSLGVKMPEDVLEGDTNLRTLRTLLSMVDERGFERCEYSYSTTPTTLFHTSLCVCIGSSPSNAIPLRLRKVCLSRHLQEGLEHFPSRHHEAQWLAQV